MVVSGIGQVVRIANVSPRVNEGSVVAKAVAGERLVVSADMFTYGQEELEGTVCIKLRASRTWSEYPLTFIHNDHWEYSFYPAQAGIYQFRMQCWINHFATWKKGLLKKYKAGQDIAVELQIGAQLLESRAARFKAKERKTILVYSAQLLAPGFDVADFDFTEIDRLMRNCREHLTVYPEILEFEVERKRAGFSSWYELFPRSASVTEGKHGTFKDVQALLPRIAEMGFDVLYLPPIHPIGVSKRKGRNNALVAAEGDPGSPWAIGSSDGGHKSIHKQLGTLKNFRELIAAAAKLDIEIAMDIAFQCSPDHPYVKQHPEWFTWRPDGTVQFAENPPKRYEDILPFNFETDDQEGLWQELCSVFTFWIEQGVRIFRVDNPHTKSFAFWEWVIPEIRSSSPEVIFLAEAFTRPRLMEQLAVAGFNQSYTYFTWRTTAKELQTYMTQLLETRYYYRPNFWPNTPDILTPELVSGGENMHIIRLILAATLSSNYGIYGPVFELGVNEAVPGKEEYNHNEKYEVRHWDWSRETRIRELITLVNAIRRDNVALQTTWNITFCETSNEKILCYLKTDEQSGNRLIVVVNLDPFATQSATVQLPVDDLVTEASFPVLDLLSLDRYDWKQGENFVRLDPYQVPAHILRIETSSPQKQAKDTTTTYARETES